METYELAAETRTSVGSPASRRLRRDGRIPVNLYGHKEDAASLSVDAREFGAAIKAHARVLELGYANQKQPAVIHDVQYDPISQEIVHIDFLRVSLTEKVDVQVSLSLIGPAKGEGEGGVLQVVHDQITLRCTPLNIPEEIKVDIRELEVGGSLHASDLTVPDGTEMVDSPELTLLSITQPRFAKEDEDEEGEEGEGDEAADSK